MSSNACRAFTRCAHPRPLRPFAPALPPTSRTLFRLLAAVPRPSPTSKAQLKRQKRGGFDAYATDKKECLPTSPRSVPSDGSEGLSLQQSRTVDGHDGTNAADLCCGPASPLA